MFPGQMTRKSFVLSSIDRYLAGFTESARTPKTPIRKFGIFVGGVFLVSILVFTLARISNHAPLTFNILSSETNVTCKTYTPLYDDAIATHQYYRERGGIQLSDLSDSKRQCDNHKKCVQLKLYDMNLYVGNLSVCDQSRSQSLLMSINLAVEQARTDGEHLPDFDVYLSCHDEPFEGASASWYLSKSLSHISGEDGLKNVFLMPDFNFYSWPETYNEPWSRAYRHIPRVGLSVPFHQKDPRMFWRGVTWTSPDRKLLVDAAKDHPEAADILEMNWGPGILTGHIPPDFISSSDMCSWKYIIYTEGYPFCLKQSLMLGRTYSGRLKYNMLCTSVIIGPKPYWMEFWSHLIVAGINYVVVEKDWSNLISTHAELEAHPHDTARIAENARKTMEYLTPVGISCYLRELIRRYADVCQWVVEAPDFAIGKRIPGSQWMPFEDFYLDTSTHQEFPTR